MLHSDWLSYYYSEEEIEKLTVAQLKFWLKCLPINQNDNKSHKKELLERYLDIIIRLPEIIDQLFMLFIFNSKFT